jgi:hypothetical protein
VADGNFAAAYYYYDAPAREYLDTLARKYELRDGIEMFQRFYAPRRSGNVETVEVDEKTRQAMVEFARQMQGMAEKMMADTEFSEEIDGDRGAVLLRMKSWNHTVRVEMVRESGAWRHPLSSSERAHFQRLAATHFDRGSRFGFH